MAKEYLNKYKDKIVLPIDNAYVDEFADKTPKFTSPKILIFLTEIWD